MTGLLVKRREFILAAAAFWALPVDSANSQVEPPFMSSKGAVVNVAKLGSTTCASKASQ